VLNNGVVTTHCKQSYLLCILYGSAVYILLGFTCCDVMQFVYHMSKSRYLFHFSSYFKQFSGI